MTQKITQNRKQTKSDEERTRQDRELDGTGQDIQQNNIKTAPEEQKRTEKRAHWSATEQSGTEQNRASQN
jgi:hypothetical protein